MQHPNWSFADYIEQIMVLSEVKEIPGISEQQVRLIEEVWQLYPQECVELGLRDHAKEQENV